MLGGPLGTSRRAAGGREEWGRGRCCRLAGQRAGGGSAASRAKAAASSSAQGQVRWQAQGRAAGVEGEPGGGVQQPVAQRLGFADGELAVEREALGPGDQVLGDQRELQPHVRCGRSRGTGGSPGRSAWRRGCGPRRWRGRGAGARARPGRRARSVRVARKRWPSWSVKDSCAPGCGRSRRTITRRARRASAVRSSAVGDLGDPGALARSAPSWRDRRPPRALGQLEDRARGPSRSGQSRSGSGCCASRSSSVNSCVAPAQSVRTTISAARDDLARELLERQLDDLDVVGGGVGAGVARPQHAGQRLAASRPDRPAAGETRSRA